MPFLASWDEEKWEICNEYGVSLGEFEVRDKKLRIQSELKKDWTEYGPGELSFEILDGIPAFMDVGDDAASEEGMDDTGQSTNSLMRYQLQVTYSAMTVPRAVCEAKYREN